eukprot:scaffold2096_cov221-Pinguiococcus_pyrenoidosus.AAC.8
MQILNARSLGVEASISQRVVVELPLAHVRRSRAAGARLVPHDEDGLRRKVPMRFPISLSPLFVLQVHVRATEAAASGPS